MCLSLPKRHGPIKACKSCELIPSFIKHYLISLTFWLAIVNLGLNGSKLGPKDRVNSPFNFIGLCTFRQFMLLNTYMWVMLLRTIFHAFIQFLASTPIQPLKHSSLRVFRFNPPCTGHSVIHIN
jgi:hypothetical protein